MNKVQIKIRGVVVANVYAIEDVDPVGDFDQENAILREECQRYADERMYILPARTMLMLFSKTAWSENEKVAASEALADQIFQAFFNDIASPDEVKAKVLEYIQNTHLLGERRERRRRA